MPTWRMSTSARRGVLIVRAKTPHIAREKGAHWLVTTGLVTSTLLAFTVVAFPSGLCVPVHMFGIVTTVINLHKQYDKYGIWCHMVFGVTMVPFG
jgi:hypothetical protein